MKKLSILAASFLTACAVGPDYHAPVTATPAQFAQAVPSEFSKNAVAVRWWTLFNDAQLSALVQQTLQHNYDLNAAQANLQEARALFVQAGLNLLPTVTSHANYTTQERSLGALNNRAFVPRNLTLYNTGFDASWELDLFGRVRRNIEASNDVVELQAASLQDVSISLIAEVARNYFELRGLQNQVALLQQTLKNQTEILDMTQARLDNGRGTALDSANAQAQLDSTRATLPPLEMRISYALHRLSVLSGKIPNSLSASLSPAAAMPKLPDIVAVGNPADLLRRRPDVRMAERQLAASTARIGIAMADLFPRVSFVGTISMESTLFTGLGATGSQAYSLGPRISWAAFDLGRVRAQIKAANAHAEADLAHYQQTVLNVLEETENALVTYNKTKTTQQLLQTAVAANRQAYDLAQLRFDNGVGDFLNVLDSQTRLFAQQNQLAQSQTNTATALVAVYKALGGGW